ncbi:hypothetical protein BC629DRAFT_164627 [Irpex lacteus]|nr:hypothetical protein BC629DRAFT_164627 [Irpex lacteus]
MFSLITIALTAAFLAVAAASPVRRDNSHGTITQPRSGIAIRPGEAFNFTYNPMADYSVSTFYYHVFLLDASSLDSDGDRSTLLNQPLTSLFSSGYYFGRYDYPNYPAVPYAKNPAPAQLTMPDFSKNAPAGWSAGESVHDLPLQLLVIEEWGNSEVSRSYTKGLPFTDDLNVMKACYRSSLTLDECWCGIQRHKSLVMHVPSYSQHWTSSGSYSLSRGLGFRTLRWTFPYILSSD